jgi:hypothetical protein
MVATYDGQNCMNGGTFPPGHEDEWSGNKCLITGCRGSTRSDHHGACQEKIGEFHCDGTNAQTLNKSMAHSWRLHDNTYYTTSGNASLPCGVTVADAALGGSGVERNSRMLALPTDAELVSMARATLGM